MWLQGQSSYQGKFGRAMDDFLYKVSSSYRTYVDGLSSVIILDELGCLELMRHNDLREIGQTV